MFLRKSPAVYVVTNTVILSQNMMFSKLKQVESVPQCMMVVIGLCSLIYPFLSSSAPLKVSPSPPIHSSTALNCF